MTRKLNYNQKELSKAVELSAAIVIGKINCQNCGREDTCEAEPGATEDRFAVRFYRDGWRDAYSKEFACEDPTCPYCFESREFDYVETKKQSREQ